MASTVVTARLDAEVEERLAQAAQERGVTRGELVRAIVEDYLTAHGPGTTGVALTVRFPQAEGDRLLADARTWNMTPGELARTLVTIGRAAHSAKVAADRTAQAKAAERAAASRPATP